MEYNYYKPFTRVYSNPCLECGNKFLDLEGTMRNVQLPVPALFCDFGHNIFNCHSLAVTSIGCRSQRTNSGINCARVSRLMDSTRNVGCRLAGAGGRLPSPFALSAARGRAWLDGVWLAPVSYHSAGLSYACAPKRNNGRGTPVLAKQRVLKSTSQIRRMWSKRRYFSSCLYWQRVIKCPTAFAAVKCVPIPATAVSFATPFNSFSNCPL